MVNGDTEGLGDRVLGKEPEAGLVELGHRVGNDVGLLDNDGEVVVVVEMELEVVRVNERHWVNIAVEVMEREVEGVDVGEKDTVAVGVEVQVAIG